MIKKLGNNPSGQRNSFYKIMGESTRDFIFLVDESGIIKYINTSAARLLNKKKEEIIGKSITELFSLQISKFQKRTIQKVIKLKKIQNFKNREIYLHTCLIPIKSKYEKKWMILGISRNITKIKKTQEKLKESESLFRTLTENSLVGVYIIQNNKFRYINPGLAQIFGYKPKEIIAKLGPLDLTHPRDRKKVREYIRRRIEREVEAVHYTFQGLRKDGKIIECEVLGRYIEFHRQPAIIGTLIDITRRKRSEEELHYRIAFENLITTIATSFINLDLNKIDQGINNALQRISEFADVDRSYVFLASEDKKRVHNTHEWCAPGIKSQIKQYNNIPVNTFPWFAKKILNLETIYIPKISYLPPEAEAEKRELLREGIRSVLIVPLVSEGSPIGILGFDSVKEEKIWSKEIISLLKIVGEMITNALERKRMEETIRKSELQHRSIINSMGEAIHVVDRNLKIVFINPVFLQWHQELGLKTKVLGKNIFEIYPFLSPKVKDEYKYVFKTGKVLTTIETNEIKTKKFIAEVRKIPISYGDKITQVLTVVRDITRQKTAEEKLKTLYRQLLASNRKLQQIALRDSHTGLFNHRYLEEAIESEFQRAKRYAQPVSIIMIDIDYFKSINDAYGHQFGDLVLKQFARELKRRFRRYDIVIRFGGEEFVIICPGTNQTMASLLAQRILENINLLHFGNKNHRVRLKLSIAVASYPEDETFEGMDLIELAEDILSKVKEFGGNKVYTSKDLESISHQPLKRREDIADLKILKEKINKLTKRANQSIIEAIFAFARTIELKDYYTGKHVERTVYYATEIAKQLNLSKEEIEKVRQAAILHDLGKVGISEKILLKKTKPTKREFEELKRHPQIGVDILRPIHFLHGVLNYILYHHERWDGKGYPRGLKGKEIPLGARIIAIADVYQALISNRPYRKAYSIEKAIEIIKEGAGTHFDPQITDAFLNILRREKSKKSKSSYFNLKEKISEDYDSL